MNDHVCTQTHRILITFLAMLLISGCASNRKQGYDCGSYRYGDLLYEELLYGKKWSWIEKLEEPGYCEPDPRLEGWAAALKLDADAYNSKVPGYDKIIVTDSELGGTRYVVLGKIRWPIFDGVDEYSCTEVAIAGRALQIYDNVDAVIVSRTKSAPADTAPNTYKRMFQGIGVSSTVRVEPGVYLNSYSSGPPSNWMTTACSGIAVKFLDNIEPDASE